MTVADGDLVTPAALFPYIGGTTTAAEALANGMLVELPVLGVVADASAAPAIAVDWNDGTSSTGIANGSLRFVGVVAAATAQGLRGKVVQLSSPVDSSQEFSGLVLSVFALEAGTVGKDGDGNVVTTDVVIFRTRTGQHILAAAANVTVVAGQ